MNNCKFCSNKYFTQLNPDTVEYSSIEICIDDEGALRARHYDDSTDKTFTTQEIVNINFCPICGRKFKR